MMASLQLEIVTPDQLLLSKEVDYVGAPGLEGEFGVLPGHIPFISALAIGGLYYKADGKTRFVFVSGGFAEISDDKVTVLAESAEEAENIDFARAEHARKRAEQRLAEKAADLNQGRALASLTRASIRLSLRGRS
ncbi:F0F1 ATP synthase subunit epsilon [Desulfovibrio sp. OttesenSCG-928-A18]|nr:F0F1 ATP synthase subunit epsilon [Desulfovibrio sp. OttesenSCG-928-A18]